MVMMTTITKSFPCTACGKCCQNVGKSEETALLDRGDGEYTKLCLIYENRPLVCQVEKYYQAYLKEIYEWDEFVKLNLEICQKL